MLVEGQDASLAGRSGRARRNPLPFVRNGLLLAGRGVAFGVAAAIAMTRLLTSLLFGVSPVDPATYVAVSMILLAVAAFASYVPAQRAMAINPLAALRAE